MFRFQIKVLPVWDKLFGENGVEVEENKASTQQCGMTAHTPFGRTTQALTVVCVMSKCLTKTNSMKSYIPSIGYIAFLILFLYCITTPTLFSK